MIDAVVLFFLFGLAAGLLRSELKLPVALYESLSVFLLVAIGLKGGQGLASQPLAPLLPQLLAVVVLGVLLTLLAFIILQYIGRFSRADASSMAAHYGSVSVATFAVGVSWLTTRDIAFESQMTIFLAVMEIPAILVGIVLMRGVGKQTRWGELVHEALLGKGVILLLGGMLIGWIAGPDGLASIKPLFFDLFKGVLALFLLEMGLIVSHQVDELKKRGLFILSFAILMPLLGAVLGAGCGVLLGLSLGGVTLLATLAASASYIAVPATMRLAIPEANPVVSLAAVLGVTFPFNILIGIPLYHRLASYFIGVFG
ncbi:sodium-dependent bicarbonate transport family permease [Iodobacter arcticus]|uniref:Sodium-dependent bicarbonate transport family permease n=1 Tax=Iodobacter arcticus TaxID=590593 RepID=A0ABW2QW50_9NEIS